MTMTVGMRELSRNSNILDGYDYIDVEDKKTHEYKGLFVSPKYAEELKEFLDEKISKENKKKLDEIMQFSGILDGKTNNMTAKEMRIARAKRHLDE